MSPKMAQCNIWVIYALCQNQSRCFRLFQTTDVDQSPWGKVSPRMGITLVVMTQAITNP